MERAKRERMRALCNAASIHILKKGCHGVYVHMLLALRSCHSNFREERAMAMAHAPTHTQELQSYMLHGRRSGTGQTLACLEWTMRAARRTGRVDTYQLQNLACPGTYIWVTAVGRNSNLHPKRFIEWLQRNRMQFRRW